MTEHRPRRFGLSKSKITAFEQCPKRLWLQTHRPELAEVDEGAEMRFAAGNAVGEIACALHPHGVMVEAEPNLAAALARTEALIAQGHPGPIFEATFQHEGVLVRVATVPRSTRSAERRELRITGWGTESVPWVDRDHLLDQALLKVPWQGDRDRPPRPSPP